MNTPLAPMPLHSPMAFPMAPGFEADNLAAQERKLALLEFWRSVVKRKWAVLGLGAAVGVVAFVVAHALTPIYQASATLLIEPTKAKILSIEEVYGGGNQQRENLQTQIEILKSRDVMERTVRALKLWENPRLDPRLSKPSWRMRAMATLGLGTVVTKTDWKEPELVDAVTGQLMSGLTIVPVRNSQLVQVMGAPHGLNVSHAGAFNDALLGFLRD